VSKLRLQISTSADGFVAGPEQSEEHPLGIGGEQLHEWALELAAWREYLAAGLVDETPDVTHLRYRFG
jgi:hypothetical protein